MDTQELLKKVRQIEIRTKHLSKHLFTGAYHSVFKGMGMSFSEVREYSPGDDVRNIDWNVTARSGSAYVKVYEEERELTVVLMVDCSSSTLFGTKTQFKSETIAEIAAVIAFAASQNQDKVGLILFHEEVQLYIPPKKGRQHILRIIREILQVTSTKKGTQIDQALKFFQHVMKKSSIAFVLSDFKSPAFDHALMIASKRHDIVGLQVYDPVEAEVPARALFHVEDAETGAQRWIDMTDLTTRVQYKQHFLKHQEATKSLFLKNNLDFVPIPSSDQYVHHLIQFFKRRRKQK